MTDLRAARLFLLDGMALIYRAHFAFIRNPRITSSGVNTSAAFGFANTLLEILRTEKPTHIAVAFDTPEPTRRHTEFPAYKAQREAMPDELRQAIPQVDRLLQAFRIPVLRYPGYEADDVIGTLARRAAADAFETWMVTPDKDFSQLVCPHVSLYKPTRDGMAKVGVEQVKEEWSVTRIEQVIDVLGLMGDASDNVPGVPGIGEKTAKKLIGQYGSVEEVIAHVDELSGKLQERIREHADQALLSKRLVTIDVNVPIGLDWEALRCREPDLDRLRTLFQELEFAGLGKRFFGDDFVAVVGVGPAAPAQLELFAAESASTLATFATSTTDYRLVQGDRAIDELVDTLCAQSAFCLDTETTGTDPHRCRLVGIAFSWKAGTGRYLPVPADEAAAKALLARLAPALTNPAIAKVGHNLKYDLTVLRWLGVQVRGPIRDTMLAHYLVEPDLGHSLDYLAQTLLGYDPIPITSLIGEKGPKQGNMGDVPPEKIRDYACEDADVAIRLWEHLEPLLRERNAWTVYERIEAPLLPVLVEMEHAGIALDCQVLKDYAGQLETEAVELEKTIRELAGMEFNVDSPKQLGEVLFDHLKLDPKAKRTSKSKQYSTDEQTLERLAGKHPLVRQILRYRQLRKLKSTYVDTLPDTVHAATGRVHTTYHQAVAATGRLASSNPNLQNIPIRSEEGREIRKAFVASGGGYKLLSADYSQIELRIIAEISGDRGLCDAFASGLDIHQATAARVYHVAPEAVTPDMRSKAKMVNYGVSYGMSAFGLAQRLNISNTEAGEIIAEYYKQFAGVQDYIDKTVAFAREKGYVETLMGRRRVLRNIDDRNATVRSAVERNAINAPIQGTAADMIKLAMINVQRRLDEGHFRTRMLLQVHDELVFDLWLEEKDTVVPIILHEMKTALTMSVPIVVDIGIGDNWLEAH